MNNTFFIISPSHFRNTAHLSKNDINMLDAFYTLSFQYTICNATPSIVKCEFDFDSELSHRYIWKGLWMRRKIYLNRSIIFYKTVQDFTHPVLKLG